MRQEIDNLNNIELMKAIYKEIIGMRENINKNSEVIMESKEAVVDKKNDERICELENTVGELKKNGEKIDKLVNTVNEMKKNEEILTNSVNEIKKDLKEIKVTLDKHSTKLEEHDKRFDILEKKTDNIDKKLDNLDKIERLHFEFTRNKFARLDKKIDTNISCLDNKIDNEAEERKVDISRIEGKNDFDRIVLSDFGSRISILEEESEKYSIN